MVRTLSLLLRTAKRSGVLFGGRQVTGLACSELHLHRVHQAGRSCWLEPSQLALPCHTPTGRGQSSHGKLTHPQSLVPGLHPFNSFHIKSRHCG